MSELDDTKPITYIPQLYINHLAEAEGRAQLNGLIKDILTQNESFKKFSQNQEILIKEQNRLIGIKIDELHSLREAFASIKRDIGGYAARQTIEQEISRLEEKIRELREKSGFTAEQEQLFLKIKTRKNDLESRKERFNRLSQEMAQIQCAINSRAEDLIDDLGSNLLSDSIDGSNFTLNKKLRGKLENGVTKALMDFHDYVKARCVNIPSNLSTLNTKLVEIEQVLTPLLQKITDSSTLQVTTSLHEAEQKKLKEISVLEEKRKNISEQGVACRNALFSLYDGLINLYTDYLAEVGKPEYQLSNDINISAKVGFLSDKFNEFLRSFDGRGNQAYLLGDLKNDDGSINFDITSFGSKINEIEIRILQKTNIPTIRAGISEKDLTKKLINDFFFIDFVVQYKEDDIVRMSPGKRGLVLLNLILHLSNASHPILVDQPEDNLDNRTIYNQLKDFIRHKKYHRQIIMVTHNANLVVASDSECVIVANQAGQTNNIDNKEFKFEYCSGSLEHSFEDEEGGSELLKKGIRQHVCEILEGGILAFKERELKYGFKI